jgi:hypothetical protein
MKVKCDDVDGDQEVYQMGKVYSTKKGTSESETSELEERNKKLRHSRKEPNKNVSKEDNARECNVSENKSHDLKAYARCTWVDGMGTNGT